MQDMNFFEPFQSKGNKYKKGSLLRLFITIVLISLVLIPASLFIMIVTLNGDLEDKNSELQIPKNIDLLNEVKMKAERIESFQIALTSLNQKYSLIQEAKWFDEELLQVIVDTLPKQIQLTDLVFSTAGTTDGSASAVHTFSVFGIAADKPAIAEFEYNLRKTDRFTAIFVSIIETEEGLMSFDLDFTVKDGTRP